MSVIRHSSYLSGNPRKTDLLIIISWKFSKYHTFKYQTYQAPRQHRAQEQELDHPNPTPPPSETPKSQPNPGKPAQLPESLLTRELDEPLKEIKLKPQNMVNLHNFYIF